MRASQDDDQVPPNMVGLAPDGGLLVSEDVHHGRQRRVFTPEYKDEAVKLVINTGRAVATVARELASTRRRWAGG
jgi:hypothetical protein